MYADAAGAAEQRGNAADPKLGNELYWGAKTPDGLGYPYNSMAHVTRTLFGRLEAGVLAGPEYQPDPADAPIPYTDPRCSGYHKNELLVGSASLDPAVGLDWKARWEDLPIDNPAQLRAARLTDSFGIVVPNAITRQADISNVRAAVKEQLQLQAARADGITATGVAFNAFKLSNTGIAVAAQVDETTDADLRFGLDRSRNTFEQLTGVRAETTAIIGAGLTANPSTVGAMSGIGIVVGGGLPRADVTRDILARLAGAQGASQCPDLSVSLGGMVISAKGEKLAAFQNPFMLGDTFRQRLSVIRDLVETEGIEAHTKAATLAGIGSAELRTWVGPGRIHTGRYPSDGGPPNQKFLFQGFLPADFGVKQAADIFARISVVFGEPWVADCAAGIRNSCPDTFQTDYVADGLSFTDRTGDLSLGGSDGRAFELSIPIGGSVNPHFDPPPVAQGAAATGFIYVVDNGGPSGPGRVLAAFKPQANNLVSTEVVSDYQRKLANDLLGVASGFDGKGLRMGGVRIAFSPNYCVEDVPHDFFVPLENELTSDSDQFEDSWKHYLDLASIAAREADALGLELINRNLAADEKKQAAREALGQACGDFGAVDKVGVGKGTIQPPDDSSALAACFDEPSYDVVFLTKDPFIGRSDAAATCEIKDLLGCPRIANDPECGSVPGLEGAQAGEITPSSELCVEPVLSHAGLGYGEWIDPRASLSSIGGGSEIDCTNALALVDDAQAGHLDPTRVALVASEAWADPEQLAALLSVTTLATDPTVDRVSWALAVSNDLALSTEDAQKWPNCALTGCSDPTFENMYSLGGNSDSESFLSARVQLETDLWGIAAIARSLPGGLFKMPIPALNFWVNGNGDADEGPVPVLFSAALFGDSPAFNLLAPADGHGVVFDQDRQALRGRVSPSPIA